MSRKSGWRRNRRVGYPVAVEAERHPLWKWDACDFVPGDVTGVEDAQFAGVGGRVVHDRENPRIVLGDAVGLGDHDRLGATTARPELMCLGRAGFDVELDDGAVQVRFSGRDLGGVAVAMPLEGDVRVVPRELLGPI